MCSSYAKSVFYIGLNIESGVNSFGQGRRGYHIESRIVSLPVL